MNRPESNREYLEVLEHLKTYHSESLGLTDYTGTVRSDNIYPKQNNVIILLSIKILEKQKGIEEKIRNIEQRLISLETAKTTHTPTPISDIDKLTEQLGRLQVDKKSSKIKEPYKFPKDEKTVFFRAK